MVQVACINPEAYKKFPNTLSAGIHYAISQLANNGFIILNPEGESIMAEEQLQDLIADIQDHAAIEDAKANPERISHEKVMAELEEALNKNSHKSEEEK